MNALGLDFVELPCRVCGEPVEFLLGAAPSASAVVCEACYLNSHREDIAGEAFKIELNARERDGDV